MARSSASRISGYFDYMDTIALIGRAGTGSPQLAQASRVLLLGKPLIAAQNVFANRAPRLRRRAKELALAGAAPLPLEPVPTPCELLLL